MALVSLEDPGLTVFATHRLLKDLAPEQQEGIRDTARALFELEEVAEEAIVPGPDEPAVSFGYMDAHHLKPWRLRLNAEGARALDAALSGPSDGDPPPRAAAPDGTLPTRAHGPRP